MKSMTRWLTLSGLILCATPVWAKSVNMQSIANNPLLRGTILPPYQEIKYTHINAAVQHLIQVVDEKIAVIEQDEATDFASLFEPLGEIYTYEEQIWYPITNLYAVNNSDALRPIFSQADQQITALELRLAQHPAIYQKLLTLEQDTSLTAVQQRMVQLRLDYARRLGVALTGKAREDFNAISAELSALGTKFTDNLLDATKDFQLVLRDQNDIVGLPASVLARAARNFTTVTGNAATAESGPWLITLDLPSYVPFMEYSERRDLREQVYRAYISLAANEPFDNTAIIKRILALRQKKAKLLGFPHHAAMVLSDKMAGNKDDVIQLLDELHAVGLPSYRQEKEQLHHYAAEHGGPAELAPWDVYFWARKMKQEQLNLDEEALRQYFPLPRVLDGLFGLLHKMFGVSITEKTATGVQTWHPDVKFYQVQDTDGTHIGSFYLDLYSRPQSKTGGAWKSNCNSRHVSGGELKLPVCHVIANFPPPIDDAPSLLNMREVEILFHEFGHAMHELLTTVEYAEIAGTKVERDAVEMPSKFMENFIYLDRVITTISGHVESGEPLPAEVLTRLRSLNNFRVASQLQRQLYYSYLDLMLHSSFDPDTQDPLTLMREIYQHTLDAPPLAADRFINSFRHIFAGGYHANYYSYKWGEVLAADAFDLFKEDGFDAAILQRNGRIFRDTVLAVGGSKSARDVFLELRGRLPSAQALLKSYGLVEE